MAKISAEVLLNKVNRVPVSFQPIRYLTDSDALEFLEAFKRGETTEDGDSENISLERVSLEVRKQIRAELHKDEEKPHQKYLYDGRRRTKMGRKL